MDFKDETLTSGKDEVFFGQCEGESVASKERTSADKDTDACRCVSEKCKQPSEAKCRVSGMECG